MLAQNTAPLLATPTDEAAVGYLMVEQEAPLSDAPLYTPQASGKLLLLLLASPKEPKDK
ncbi:hypothetical protein [Streptomyces zagrosensis]|uniref:Uncharacterized protein n=1 Tax=Streptomyces zagrosensis TaxID=1042984 RepID=A0A7W9UXK2_9ACTN|nr:hypothetical protein [Streptomyces zagrosensis]MBB5934727.1 hypothetical protein [Streptomyces zagrosensis]